jgi:PAS domain S-box-containing protein
MAGKFAVWIRSAAIKAAQQYGPVLLSIAGAAGISLLLRQYVYPRPLFLLALVFSIWGRGPGPGLFGAGLAILAVRFVFPELLLAYGLISDTLVFGFGSLALVGFSNAKLRAEARRKLVEEQLRASERHFIDAQRLAQVGSWERYFEGEGIYWSDEMFRIFGLPTGTPLHFLRFLSYVHPEDRRKIFEADERARSSYKPAIVEYRIIRPEGELRHVRSVVEILSGHRASRSWISGTGQEHQGEHLRLAGATQDITEQVYARAAMRESEERFRATFFQAAVGMAQISLKGEWLLLNDRLYEILGYAKEELRSKTFLEITHPDDRQMTDTAMRRLLSNEVSSWFSEKRCIHKDGTPVWTKLALSLVWDQDNRPEYFIAVVEDVTEKILAESALRESEQRLALAQTAAKLGSWDWNLRTNAHNVFGEYLRLYGLPRDHPPLTYEEWLQAIHPDDRQRVQALVREATEQTHVWDTEFRVIWPDGTVHWMLGRGTVFFDDCGQAVRIAGVNLDITDRKQAEAALRESELQYKEVFDNISECMFLIDVTADKRFKFAGFNPAEERAVGLSNAEVSGKFVEEVFTEELTRKLTANYHRCLDAGVPISYDDELNLPGGRRYFHSNLIPLRDSAGRIRRLVGACLDITQQKLAERTRQESLDEIAHLNRVAAMGELTASLAHELNQPLAAILSNAQAASRFLNREFPDLARVQECLTAIVADDKRAGEVIKRLRGLLKKGEYQASLVDLNEVVSDALRLVANDALLRQTSVRFQPQPGVALVLGDRIQLYQVVLNLIANGVEAAAERRVGERWVLVRTDEAASGGVQLTVEDSGSGIAERDLVRVFEPFFTTKNEGLGMGLSISRSIVQTHSGRIWAENSAKGGAVFRCVLPAAQQTAAAASEPYDPIMRRE